MSKSTIIYRDVAPGATRNARFSGTEYDDFSQLDELRNEHEPKNIVSLERNMWVLGRGFKILDKSEHLIPFWSAPLSDENCNLNPYPTITIDFTAQYSTTGLTVQFDEPPGAYCADLHIKWYRNGSIVAEGDFYPDTNTAVCAMQAKLFNRIEITFRRTALPYRRVRIKQIIFGIIRKFGMDEIRSARITNQMNHISAELPISTLDWTLDSKKDVDFMFQFKQPVEVANDDFTIGVYYINEARRTSKSVHNIRAQDAFGVLDDDTFIGGIYVNYSAKKLFSEIVGDDFEIDFGTVKDVNLTGLLEPMTKRAALQQVLFGWGVCAATDGGEIIRVFGLDDNAEYIGLDRAYTGVSVETTASITALSMTAHDYQEDENGSIEINGKKYRDVQTVYTINNQDVSENTKANVLKVETASFINTGNVEAAAQRVYDYYMKRSTANVKIVWHGELLGGCVTVPDAWGGTHTGNVEQMDIILSNTVSANTKVISDS